MGQVLDVRVSANVVEFLSKNRRVASHKRSYAKGIAVTDAVAPERSTSASSMHDAPATIACSLNLDGSVLRESYRVDG